ncbi:MAG: ATP synthase subunit I [Firmicutes bacterium]|nr:ATP synthase subunit I [Bacillota bacterium]
MNLWPIAEGFLLGAAVSAFNHLIVWQAIRGSGNQPSETVQRTVMGRYLVRLATNFLALFIAFKLFDPSALLATAIGLTMARNVLVVRAVFSRNKGGE